MSAFYYLIGFVLFLELFRRGHTALRLSRIELGHEPKSMIPPSEIPAYELALLSGPRAALEALGFVYSHAERWNRWESGVDCRLNELVFVQPGKDVRAYLSPSVLPDAWRNYCLTFVTTDKLGQVFRSLDAAGYFHFFPGSTMKIISLYSLTPEQHLAEHNKWAPEPAPCDSDAKDHFLAELSVLAAWISEHAKTGELICGAERTGLSARGAFVAAQRIIAELGQSAQMRAKAEKNGRTEPNNVPLDAEVAAFERVSKVNNGQTMKRAAKLLLFIITALLFLASFGLSLSWHSVLILLFVIFFHELGHVLAMRAFGYQDLKILFLPFLGAVAVGRRKNVPIVQKVIVALAGPLPGLVLGLGCAAAVRYLELSEHSILNELSWTLLGINFFNLLPIMPLDGGQVLHALLFCRFPLLEALFAIFGGVALALLGYFGAEPVLGFVALLILIATKDQVRRSRLLKSLRRKLSERGEEPSEEELTRTVFGHLSESGCEKLPFARRYQLADYLLTNARAPGATLAQTWMLFTFYLLSLALAPVLFVILAWNSAEAGSEEDEKASPPAIKLEQPDRTLPGGAIRA